VHLSNLKNSTAFSRLSAVMGGFGAELRRYRVVGITGIEAGFPRAYLGDLDRQLKMHWPSVALTFNLNDPDPLTALKFSPSAIGFAMPPGMGEMDLKPEYVNRIRALSAAARPQQVPVFIDGRAELYGEAFDIAYYRAMQLKDVDGFLDMLRTWDIDAVLLTPSTPAVGLHDHTAGWQRVYSDGNAVLHVRTVH